MCAVFVFNAYRYSVVVFTGLKLWIALDLFVIFDFCTSIARAGTNIELNSIIGTVANPDRIPTGLTNFAVHDANRFL